jgi:regulator of RNase E activity RraA
MDLGPYRSLLTTDISDAMGHGYAMDIGIRSLLTPTPAIMGIAYTVKCINRSNTHLHNALYDAPKGSIVVAETDGNNYAVAGGNVCAVAQQNDITGFIIDGVARDLGEIRSLQFPVFARGIYPKPGNKTKEGFSQCKIACGNVVVNPGDLVVADEEGIVVVPQEEIESILEKALMKKAKAEKTPLEEWRKDHEQKIKAILPE